MKTREYQARSEAMNNQIEIHRASIAEHERTIETIKQIKYMEPGDAFLAPIGADSYIYSSISSTDQIIVSLGADVSAEQNPDEAVDVLTKRKDNLTRTVEDLRKRLSDIQQEIERLQAQISKYLQEQQR